MAALSGTLLNAATVLIGGLLGTALGDRLPATLRENVVRGVGLFTLAMGVKFAIDTTNLLYVLGAMVIGGIVGSVVGVDSRLNQLGEGLQRRFARGATSTVAEGFVTAAIIFCVAAVCYGWQVVRTAWLIDERSASDLRFPMWIYYAALPTGGLLMLIRYVIRLVGLVSKSGRGAAPPRRTGAHELPGVD